MSAQPIIIQMTIYPVLYEVLKDLLCYSESIDAGIKLNKPTSQEL